LSEKTTQRIERARALDSDFQKLAKRSLEPCHVGNLALFRRYRPERGACRTIRDVDERLVRLDDHSVAEPLRIPDVEEQLELGPAPRRRCVERPSGAKPAQSVIGRDRLSCRYQFPEGQLELPS